MRKLIIFLSLIVFSLNVIGQDFFNQEDIDNSKNRIVILHPTVYNLEVYSLLIEKEMFNIDNLEIIGVYYEKEAYDYSESLKWIENNESKTFFLHELKGNIEIEDIYKENELSKGFEKIFKNSKGIIFMGGDDIPSRVYNQKTKLLTAPDDPYRNIFETSFMYHLIGETGKIQKAFISTNPYYVCLGICLGMQTMNVANGGTLYQDIPTEIYNKEYAEDVLEMDKDNIHKNYNRWVDFGDSLSNGNLHKIKQKGKEIMVYSNHHQCINNLGVDYSITATSMDEKVPEAIQHKTYKNVYGVQFHPETKAMFKEDWKFKFKSSDNAYFFGEKCLNSNPENFHKQFWDDFISRFK